MYFYLIKFVTFFFPFHVVATVFSWWIKIFIITNNVWCCKVSRRDWTLYHCWSSPYRMINRRSHIVQQTEQKTDFSRYIVLFHAANTKSTREQHAVNAVLLPHRSYLLTFFESYLIKTTVTHERKGKKSIYIAPFTVIHSKRSGVDHTVLPANNTTPAFPSWEFTRCHHHSNCGSRHPIAAHYSFIDPERMKGWVGLVGMSTWCTFSIYRIFWKHVLERAPEERKN